MYSIGELSKRTGVKVPTIRYYETMGLIDSLQRTQGNQRRYCDEGLARLSFIRHSRGLGFSIEDIKGLLVLNQHPEKPCIGAHHIAVKHLSEVKNKIAKLKRLESELKRIIKCEAHCISNCAIIETLADHALCKTEH